MKRLTRAGLGGLVLLAAGCGGSTAASVDGGGAADGSVVDGSVATDSSTNGAIDSSLADAGATDASDGGDAAPNCVALGATTDSCRTCCANEFAAGSKVFDRFTAECACQPAFCGALDAGVSDAAAGDAGEAGAIADEGGAGDAAATADAGLYGSGVCTATCEGKQAPDPTCNTCILSTLGSVSNLGPCGSTVLSQCLADPDCTSYLIDCVENCP